MNQNILEIYKRVPEALLVEYITFGTCCFCRSLAAAMVAVEYNLKKISFPFKEDFTEAYEMVEAEFTPVGEFSELYSYMPENKKWCGNYWFDPRDYETRKTILEKILQTVPS